MVSPGALKPCGGHGRVRCPLAVRNILTRRQRAVDWPPSGREFVGVAEAESLSIVAVPSPIVGVRAASGCSVPDGALFLRSVGEHYCRICWPFKARSWSVRQGLQPRLTPTTFTITKPATAHASRAKRPILRAEYLSYLYGRNTPTEWQSSAIVATPDIVSPDGPNFIFRFRWRVPETG
jgi:hypothetical protein